MVCVSLNYVSQFTSLYVLDGEPAGTFSAAPQPGVGTSRESLVEMYKESTPAGSLSTCPAAVMEMLQSGHRPPPRPATGGTAGFAPPVAPGKVIVAPASTAGCCTACV